MASDTGGWKSVIPGMIALSLYSELYMPNIILFTPISVLSPSRTGLFNEANSNRQSAVGSPMSGLPIDLMGCWWRQHFGHHHCSFA